MLVARGLGEPEAAAQFLAHTLADLPDPFLMRGMRPAVDRLVRAVQARELVTLYGDYDVDGVCSTALTSLFLEECGARVATCIPHRIRDGYGLNRTAVERIAQDGTAVLVTLDCGITAAAEVGRAKDLGLEVVVVDHHTVPARLPPLPPGTAPLRSRRRAAERSERGMRNRAASPRGRKGGGAPFWR